MSISRPDPLTRGLFALFALGVVGTLADLLFEQHWKEWTQWAPLALLGTGVLAVVWHAVEGSATSRRGIAVVSWAFVPAALAGWFFHLRANVEWARDDAPELSGWPLLKDTIFGTLPTLAPGAMLYLGLIGLLYVRAHSVAHRSDTHS